MHLQHEHGLTNLASGNMRINLRVGCFFRGGINREGEGKPVAARKKP